MYVLVRSIIATAHTDLRDSTAEEAEVASDENGSGGQ